MQRRYKTFVFILTSLIIIVPVAIRSIGMRMQIQRVNATKCELRLRLKSTIEDDRPGKIYLKKRYAVALSYLEDKQLFEQPFGVGALATCFERNGSIKYVLFSVLWLEEGFESTGLHLSLCHKDTVKEIRIPFPEDIWDRASRKWYRDTYKREFSFAIVYDDSEIGNLPVQVRSTVAVTTDFRPEHGTLSVCDSRGQISQPVDIFFFEENRQIQ